MNFLKFEKKINFRLSKSMNDSINSRNGQPSSTVPKWNQFSSAPLAHPLHVQELEKHLDLNKFIDQLDVMFSEPM